MKTLGQIAELGTLGKPVCLAIGMFDGVHRGHQALVAAMQKLALEEGAEPVVVTFDPHPGKVLRPGSGMQLLTSTRQKLSHLERYGVPTALVIHFDEQFAATAPEEFIASLCRGSCGVRWIAVGHRWEFGCKRSGNVALLERLGAELGFRVLELPPVTEDGDLVSSTRIRQAIRDGNLAQARLLLGHQFSVMGQVVPGDQIGRTIGFPTANILPEGEMVPPDGVYAGGCQIGGQSYAVAVNIGVRPTMGQSERRVEAHIIGFTGELYGTDLELEFYRAIRGEKRFATLEDLKRQIAEDTVEAVRIFEAKE